MRQALLLPLILLAPLLAAQEKSEVSLAVGFPSTTIVYTEGDVGSMFKTLSDPGLLKGLGANIEVPDLGKLVEDSLEIELTDAEVRQIVGGIQRGSFGLLDFGIGGPKFQIIVRHEDPTVLSKALARALDQGAETVVGAETYEGVKIYQIDLPGRETDNTEDFPMPRNPLAGMLNIDSIWLAVHTNRHVIAGTGVNSIKDAIDYLSFPDDTTDTLLGNKRFQEALVEFKNPDGLVFVNTTALINTLERAGGDKGNTPLADVFGGEIRFFVELMEYKQLKSIAAGYWVDEKTSSVRMDARVQFHNEPGWYSALKLKPVSQPLADFVPADTLFGLTYGIESPVDIYGKIMELLKSRAKEGGQEQVLKWLNDFENKATEQGVPVKDLLKQLANAQAFLVLPRSSEKQSGFSMPVDFVGLVGLRDAAEAEEFLYEKILKTDLGKPARQADLEMTILEGVEIHHAPAGADDNPMAFAFAGDVFILGQLQGIKRVVMARKNKQTLSGMPAYKQARSLIWEQCGGTAYLNLGAFIQLMDFRAMFMDDESPRESIDATEADANAVPYLSRFFGETVVVWGTQAREKELAMRIAVAGWPSKEKFKLMAEHFRDVGRNKEVRDDFIELLNGATAHYALKGKAPKLATDIEKAGYVSAHAAIVDPYGEAGEERLYSLTEVPDSVDIRQAILLAFQTKPGLDGLHLGVLWKGDVVKLTPQQLKEGVERAMKGLPLEKYTEVLPLHKSAGEASAEPEMIPEELQVEVIDDDGGERVISVSETEPQKATETQLDNPPPKREE